MKLAQVNIGQEFGSPFGQEGGSTLGDLVTIVISNAFTIAGVILLFMLIVGGIGMIIGANQDDPERAAKGRQTATSAVIGFIIVFAAYWIVQILEAITGVGILAPNLN